MSVTTGAVPEIQLTPLENTLKNLLLDVAQYIHERASTEGSNDANLSNTVLRFTGGWVRDKLLGVNSQDIDVGINNMTGYQFGLLLKEYLDIPGNLDKYRKDHASGDLGKDFVSLHKIEANPEKSKHLETVTTNIFGLDVDLVNLRKETYTADSRNPQMEFGTAEEDALRRDATINALFYNLNETTVEDLTRRGLQDMHEQIIRTPLEPYQTFQDDPLRVLRLIRFASRLGYRIHPETEEAMQNTHIGEALRLKISRERVLKELEKMLHGPDPRGALHFIDRLGLYPTIFANFQDDATVETSSWPNAYNTVERLIRPTDKDPQQTVEKIRNFLIRDKQEEYYAWMLSAMAPWSKIPTRPATGKGRPPPPRAAEVARDSLRADNKVISVVGDAAASWQTILEVKNSILEGTVGGTAAEVRKYVGLHIRSWKKDWRLCILQAILQEVMDGREYALVVEEYARFIAYIEEENLQDVYEMKPLVNGDQIMKAMGGKKGRWLATALQIVVEWQLLHPDSTDQEEVLKMEELRAAARASLPGGDLQPPEAAIARYTLPGGLEHLWQDISSEGDSSAAQICKNLLVAQAVLKNWTPGTLLDADIDAANSLYDWASEAALPSPIFAETIEEASQSQLAAVDAEKQKLAQAITVISTLKKVHPIQKAANISDILVALASFSSTSDPWTTGEAHSISIEVLREFSATARSDGSLWTILETTLKKKIRPLFTKTRNPAITAEGRKNFHPVPLARFDLTTLDPEAKPWKAFAVYSTTVFAWILSQYDSTAITHLENQFSQLIPPILALIDDELTPHRIRGCTLLTSLLQPIRASQSDILRRTNLSSVFESAIRPCLLSLPTITPENESLELLTTAYPALHALLETSYGGDRQRHPQQSEALTHALTQTLRDNLISSFHHISSTSPITAQSSVSYPALTSFPHPRLSTLLLSEIQRTVTALRIEATKYLQDLVPLVYSTLTNPFGTAHPPLLLAALGVARAVILNAHPRVWRWRTEILGAVCACWLTVVEEEREEEEEEEEELQSTTTTGHRRPLRRLKRELQGVVCLLRLAIENPLQSDTPEQEALSAAGGGGFGRELEELAAADEQLRGLLLGEVDRSDGRYFGVDE
ncbi:tRNA adenylyltransferase [Aspergillus saccharolyticus JOP 1030-1]|uniref:ATP:tRNA-specific tRNA nucleotidyltransferase n=1 Tax=Aspergillus saccharolyticus JOP 1030-1 TaxID=1450539 RepID=A0A318ZA40_9EURO|nr:ATP :tRNA-specific tRNA nucleotidyltransferase [Aspergillus saccharolyticus JOP 1030-1]PYH41573.1 ATP :tRNA-specific tRNA nucleotidyltransferase [Aspergillus saccharolyticus JOP 1030-1]